MTLNVLEKIFGSVPKVKMMKMFLFNPDINFEKGDITRKAKITAAAFNKEIKSLEDSGMVKKKVVSSLSRTKKRKTKKTYYVLNNEFRFLSQLQNLLINNEGLQATDITKRLNKTGKVKMIIISGVFIQADDSRVDLLLVGDEIKDRSVKTAIQNMEADIGKELRYTVLKTDDYKYRYNVCDKLIRDILDYPHEVIVDRIGL